MIEWEEVVSEVSKKLHICLMEKEEFRAWKDRKDQERKEKTTEGEYVPECLKEEEE